MWIDRYKVADIWLENMKMLLKELENIYSPGALLESSHYQSSYNNIDPKMIHDIASYLGRKSTKESIPEMAQGKCKVLVKEVSKMHCIS